METMLERASTLERTLDLMVSQANLDAEVETRLKRLARNVKMSGFRPGKVPFKMVVQQYGGQVRQEALGDTVQQRFVEAIREQNLRVAGYPRIEAKPDAAAGDFVFSATFEVYPEVVVGNIAAVTIERPSVTVSEADVDKTIEVLRKQRVHFEPVTRAAATGDRVEINYRGMLDGEVFKGGQADNYTLTLGEGRALKDFEDAIVGLAPGGNKSFELTFPADYHAGELAGKTVVFEVTLNQVFEPRLPELDAEFAKTLGVESGDLDAMRSEVRVNIEREVKKRIQARTKEKALQALLDVTPFDLPSALVEAEIGRLREYAGSMNAGAASLPDSIFDEQARQRVQMGLALAEVIKANQLTPKPEEVRRLVDEAAESYERPDEVVSWYYAKPERLAEVESAALEESVVSWILEQAQVVEKAMGFDELMGNAG